MRLVNGHDRQIKPSPFAYKIPYRLVYKIPYRRARASKGILHAYNLSSRAALGLPSELREQRYLAYNLTF